MIAKCPACNFVRIQRQRKTCPHCKANLTRPTADELADLGTHAMERSRAARALIQAENNPRPLILAGFMAIFHGQHLTARQAEEMLKT